MNEQKTDASWWQTLPGLLTGVAAVLTAAGGIIAVVHRSDDSAKNTPGPATVAPRGQSPDPATSAVAPPAAAASERQSGQTGEVRAGHYVFKLLNTEITPYSTGPDGRPQKFAVRLFIRVTEVMGKYDSVDRSSIRLLVDGAQLTPENSIFTAVFERTSEDIEALFIVPADASSITLLLGRQEDSVATLPLPLTPLRAPEQQPGRSTGTTGYR